MTKQEKFWFFWLLALIALGILTGCKTKYVSVPEYHNVIVNKHDTMYTRDSIYHRDSIFMWREGDTIWKERVTIMYRDRWRDKMVYRDSVRVDSIRVPYPVERQATWWERTWTRIGKISVIVFVLTVLGIICLYLIRLRARSRISRED